jgi:hypothetical protein
VISNTLSLAAAPTFALMAALSRMHDGGMAEMFCPAMPTASPFTGMVPMYLLMSAFHLTPWLKLLPRRRSDAPGIRLGAPASLPRHEAARSELSAGR